MRCILFAYYRDRVRNRPSETSRHTEDVEDGMAWVPKREQILRHLQHKSQLSNPGLQFVRQAECDRSAEVRNANMTTSRANILVMEAGLAVRMLGALTP